jgi:hypothetical protein
MIKEIGFYEHPDKVGWSGWITTNKGTYFVALDGSISDCYPVME